MASGTFGCSSQGAAEPIAADQIRVIDGDTLRLFNMQPNVRLVGFNAPETRRAKCDYERQLGDQATRRVRVLVHSETLDFEYVDCSCPPGTEETLSCNYLLRHAQSRRQRHWRHFDSRRAGRAGPRNARKHQNHGAKPGHIPDAPRDAASRGTPIRGGGAAIEPPSLAASQPAKSAG
jgi:hypothetical protein